MSDHRHHRASGIGWIVAGIVVILLCGGIFAMTIPPKTPYHRETIILAGNPMVVVSWSPESRVLTTLTFPSDMAAEGTHGYGTYSFDALWKLGQIDKKNGTVLAESMAEALGVPVPWYIGPRTGSFQEVGDGLSIMRKIFSMSEIAAFLSGHFRTNIPFSSFLSLAWTIAVNKPDRIDTFDFTGDPALVAVDVVRPDGSHQWVIDPTRVDVRLAHVFEDALVRQESISIALYNTTTIPSLGTRAARMLTDLGVAVVTVGNDTPEVDACTLSGSETSLKSRSAKVIESVLGCVSTTTAGGDRADLVVRVGKAYAKRFEPN